MKSIKYVDFNNNTYSITSRSIHYQPIKMEFSSSGLYDGGEEKKVTLTETVFNKIVELVQLIIDDTALHRTKREMLTSIIQVDGKRWIIGRSVKQDDLYKCLKKNCILY